MEKIFIDTSALYALVSTGDNETIIAVETWETMLENKDVLITNNYVIVECFSLVQHRLGVEFARHLQSHIVPFLQVDWADEKHHLKSIDRVFSANRRQLSLVDCSSFETMRRLKIEKVFTLDDHFREQGFDVIP